MSDPIISANIPDPLSISAPSDCFITGTGDSPTETLVIHGADEKGAISTVTVERVLHNSVTITVECALGSIAQDSSNPALWRYTPPA